MSGIYIFKPPEEIIERDIQLRALIRNHGANGQLPAVEVARYLKVDYDWFRRAIDNGGVPFAFSYRSTQRVTSYIGTYPFYQFETQCAAFIAEITVQRQAQAAKEGIICK